MQNPLKDWLVRTRTGEILGPFTQRELFDEMSRRAFTPDDEIAQSLGHWISASTLVNREADEFTHTHTRKTSTKSIASNTLSKTYVVGHTLEDTLTPTPRLSEDTLTPTPRLEPAPFDESAFATGSMNPPRIERKLAQLADKEFDIPSSPPKLIPFLITVAVIGGLWVLVNNFRTRPKPPVATTKSATPPTTTLEGESPFVRQMNGLIRAGETQLALKQLTQYHEKHPPKGEIEYLIPYAALLITEGDSGPRAKKFLEQVLAANVSPQLKSRAHHWLGYLMLSESGGDNETKTDMGESHFLECLQLNPKDAAARFNLGRVYLKQKKWTIALDYLQLAEVEVPDLWLVHVYKGRAKAAMSNMEEARASFKKAIEVAPERWITYIYYAVFLELLKEKESSQLIMRKMLTRDPNYEVNSPTPWGYYEDRAPYSDYLETFEDIMGRTMNEEKELGKLYISYLMNGTAGSEAKRLEAVAEKGGLMSKVFALKVALDKDAPAEKLREAVQRLPASLRDFGYFAYVLRGDARTRLGQFSEAQSDLLTAIQMEPHSAVARWAYATFLKKTQRASEADSEIKSLLTYHPNYIPAVVSSHNF